jgi:hypothetical protein
MASNTKVKLYLYKGATRDVSRLTNVVSREIVLGHVTGIDLVTNGPDPDALYNAQQAVEAVYPYGSALSENQLGFIFNRAIFRGVSPTFATCELYFETPVFDGPPSSFVFTESGQSQSCTTSMIPGTRQQIKVEWYNDDYTDHVPKNLVTFTYDRTIRTIDITALIYGTPPPPPTGVYNRVNSLPWQGLGMGFWRVMLYQISASVYEGYYTKRVVVAAKEDEDWSSTGVLLDTRTGRYVIVDDDDIADLIRYPYKFGIIYPNADSDDTPGIVRAGLYQMVDFGQAIGIPNDPTPWDDGSGSSGGGTAPDPGGDDGGDPGNPGPNPGGDE